MSGKDKITSCVVWKIAVSVSKLPPDSLVYFLKVFLRQEMQIVSLTKRSAERVHLTLSLKLLPVMLTAGLPGSWKIRKSLLQEEIKRDEERERRGWNEMTKLWISSFSPSDAKLGGRNADSSNYKWGRASARLDPESQSCHTWDDFTATSGCCFISDWDAL